MWSSTKYIEVNRLPPEPVMVQMEGSHTSSEFRIETLLRTNPEISDYLSCNNTRIEKVTCTFDGL